MLMIKTIILVSAIVAAIGSIQSTAIVSQLLDNNSNYVLLREASAKRESSDTQDYSNDHLKTYENNDLGIKLLYPSKDWDYSYDEGKIIFTTTSRDGVFTIESVVMTDRYTNEKWTYSNIVDVANKLIDQYKSSNPSVQVFSVTPNEDLSAVIRMGWTSDRTLYDDGIFLMRTGDNEFLLMEYTSDYDTYSKYSDDVTNMISSVEIIDGHNYDNDYGFRQVHRE